MRARAPDLKCRERGPDRRVLAGSPLTLTASLGRALFKTTFWLTIPCLYIPLRLYSVRHHPHLSQRGNASASDHLAGCGCRAQGGRQCTIHEHFSATSVVRRDFVPPQPV